MSRYVLAVLQHPELEGLCVTVTEAQGVHGAPQAMAIMNRVAADYRLITTVPVKSQDHGESVIEQLVEHAVPGGLLHFRVTPRQVRSLARPSLWRRVWARLAPRRVSPIQAEDISGQEKRQMAFDLWAYKKIARARLPFVLLAVLIAPVVAISPWYLFYVGGVEGSGDVWHALTSVAIFLAVFYGIAFAAARPAVDEMRLALSQQAIFSR